MSRLKSVPSSHFEKKMAYTIGNLKAACDRYDQGQFFAASTIASDLALLILDKRDKHGNIKRDGTSLMRRIGLYPAKALDRSMQKLISMSHLHGALCAVGYGRQSSLGFFPILDSFPEFSGLPKRIVAIEDWWEAKVLRDRYGNLFSRRYLLETFRDKIANHTDAMWPEELIALSFEDSMTHAVSGRIVAYGDMDPFRIAIRQMAYEILSVIDPDHRITYTAVPARECLPIVLFEIFEEVTPDNWVSMSGPEAIEAHCEFTSSPEVFDQWKREEQNACVEADHSEHFATTEKRSDDVDGVTTGGGAEKRRRGRLAMVNPSPYEMPGISAQFATPSCVPTYESSHVSPTNSGE